MHAVIRFETAAFDVSTERVNPINPIAGESLILWLVQQLVGEVTFSSAYPEDWGWAADIEWKGQAYTLGASASDDAKEIREWVLQVMRSRSVKERIVGNHRADYDLDCIELFYQLLAKNPIFANVAIEQT